MTPVLGRKVVETEQIIPVLFEAVHSSFVFGLVLVLEDQDCLYSFWRVPINWSKVYVSDASVIGD